MTIITLLLSAIIIANNLFFTGSIHTLCRGNLSLYVYNRYYLKQIPTFHIHVHMDILWSVTMG